MALEQEVKRDTWSQTLSEPGSATVFNQTLQQKSVYRPLLRAIAPTFSANILRFGDEPSMMSHRILLPPEVRKWKSVNLNGCKQSKLFFVFCAAHLIQNNLICKHIEKKQNRFLRNLVDVKPRREI